MVTERRRWSLFEVADLSTLRYEPKRHHLVVEVKSPGSWAGCSTPVWATWPVEARPGWRFARVRVDGLEAADFRLLFEALGEPLPRAALDRGDRLRAAFLSRRPPRQGALAD